MTVQRSQVLREARTWIGTPFHHQGRQKAVGVDCVGLTIGVALSLGLIDESLAKSLPTDYRQHPDAKLMKRLLRQHMSPCWPPEPGDWIWVAKIGHLPTHLAMVASDSSVIHADAERKAVVEHPLRAAHLRMAKGAFAYRGIADG